MLVTLCFVPIFFIFGIAFGSVSWLLAAWVVCGDKEWTLKWQFFVRSAAKMSTDHNILVVHGAEFIETFECIKPCRESGKTLLIQYYKIGHSLSIYLVLFLLTTVKALLLVPIWSALCCQEAHHRQREKLLRTKSIDKGTNELLKVSGQTGSNCNDTSSLKGSGRQTAYDDTAYVSGSESPAKGNHVASESQVSEYTASGAAYDTSWIVEDE